MLQQLVAPSLILTAHILILFALSVTECKSQDLVEKYCKLGLNFESINEFEKFMSEFLKLSNDQLASRKSLKICASDSEAIRALAELITTKDVCDMQRIDQLIAYHKQFFIKKGILRSHRKLITHEFFTRYAIQVALVCKRNLFKNLELARAELKDRSKVFEEAKERVYNDEPAIKSNIKLIEEQPDDPPTSNVKPRDEAEITLSEYREALAHLKQPEDILTFDPEECKNRKGTETLISKDKIQTFFKPALMCHQLHRYYAGSILSIAKLANIGYVAPQVELDNRIADDPIIREWIVAVQVCEPMMHMKGNEATRGEMVVVDTCSEKISAIEPIVYEDSFDDFENSLLDELIPKSEATRRHAQKIMKSMLKKMAKVNLMKQLKSGGSKKSIFKRSLMMATHKESQYVGGRSSKRSATMSSEQLARLTAELTEHGNEHLKIEELSGTTSMPSRMSEEDAYNTLMEVVLTDDKQMQCPASEDNGIDEPVSFDPLSSLASSLLIMAIMLVFEWVFFIVMTVAARVCHELHLNFENMLTFPPKVLSFSETDFARFTEQLEYADDDDFFDYEEQNPEEERRRELLAKVFGRPPPIISRD